MSRDESDREAWHIDEWSREKTSSDENCTEE